jgi:hypothetical protein
MEINVGVNGGQVSGGERSESSEWDEWSDMEVTR